MQRLITCFLIIQFCIHQILLAQDTFSICAVDPVTGEVGSAGASCIAGSKIISDIHAGVGVIHTQAYYLPGNQNYAEDLMDEGVSPDDIIDSLIANDVSGTPEFRQYGIVDLVDGGRSAAYTGSSTDDYKNHITGPTYAIQGNILLGQEILDSMEAKFLNTEGTLACRLMAALQGANVPGADTRCLDDGISSLSAFLRVAVPDDGSSPFIDFNVANVGTTGIEPIDSLQTLFDAEGGCSTVAIHVPLKPAIKIFPVPASEKIIVQNTGDYVRIILRDITGKYILEKEVSGNEMTISVHDFSAGWYVIELIAENGESVSGKIILE
ncbi:MAG: DUF1028 domain-containing protein [Chitinophagales bacterium]|nr:DUF1028 domain-containing protein [Chitinophagales bacterium]